MITRQEVEQELQSLDPTRPDFWLSEGPWSFFRALIECGDAAWFYLTQEKQIRKLALRYKAKPEGFRRALERRNARHGGMPLVKNDAPAKSLSLPTGTSQRHLKAFKDFAPTIVQMILGGPSVAASLEPRPKEILAFIRALAAKPAGRGLMERHDAALKLYVGGEKNFHVIYLRTNPDYAQMTQPQKEKARKAECSAVRRRLRKLARDTKSPS